ncbi:adenylate cyclase [Rhizobium rosettiformans]|uniref:Adenylate/guanylate cyclase domain-containing protein n=2 Tax=Rhizobium rosettiformans TaxID=1368430 RepID=A0A4S8Q5F9_9HYPH|nr:adenylate/guanylate cyclase domain-containing protein [Rhizobium rosettiformans]MBB5274474.1 adenylate cyclase [Rhizobium rosettiformans]THV37912.1 adenylate/guanylate cyclase domain-containing protein [Rhizobium rosettiformans W3]
MAAAHTPRRRLSSSQRRKLGVSLIGAAALSAVLTAHAAFAPQAFRLTALVFDTYQTLKPREATDPPVAVIDIDEASIGKLGQWPWSRRTVAEIVERASGLGAAAIGFDIVFSEPDRTAPGRLVEEMRAQGIAIEVGSGLPDPDAQLAEAVASNAVALGIALTNERSSPAPEPKAGFSFVGPDPRARLIPYSGALSNLPDLTKRATALGYFSFPPTADNIIRTFPLIAKSGDQLYPALSIETLRIAQQAGSFVLRSAGTAEGSAMTDLRVGALDIPLSADGEIWIYYSGLPNMPVISAADFFDPARAATLMAQIQGRILLVGTSAVGLRDIVATPVDRAMAGVKVHAEIIDQIASGVFLQRPDWIVGAERAAAVLAGLVLLAVLATATPAFSVVVALVLAALITGGSWLAFSRALTLFDPLLPLTSLAAVLLTALPLLLMLTHREKRFVRESFGRYLSPTLVERLSENPEGLTLGGEDRELTVLFSDIRGFTTLSERLSPTELTGLLNNFLTPMTDVLLKREATIDKYIGDAIMAFWNAPLDIADHPQKACLAALDMVSGLERLNRESGLNLKIGIGLNTGMACVGNLGSDQRFSYSCLGDSVNLASRVEGMTKLYEVSVLVTEDVRARTSGLAFAEVDRVRVVGRNAPVTLHALIGEEGESAADSDLLSAHAMFISAWQEGDFSSARLHLQDLLQRSPNPLSGTHALYRDRLAELPETAPADWDGVFTASSK